MHMSAAIPVIFLFLIALITVVACVAGGLRAGLKALPPSGSSSEFAATRRFLALNLCEAPVNIIVIPLLAFLMRAGPFRGDPLYTGLAYTWPMAVLLVPAFGLFFQSRLYRTLSLKILLLGLGRWAINLLIFGLMGVRDIGPGLAMILIVVGCALLIYSFIWGRQWLNDELEYPPLPPITLRPPIAQPVSAARLAPSAPPIVVHPPDPGVRCPVCHAPSSLRDAMCAACGLVFVSRVPVSFRQLSGYSALRPLEIGGMSHVYLARAHADGQLYALKALAAVDDAAGLGALACLRREAALLARLDHPNVVRAHEWREGDAPCLVMPYVPGPTLEATPTPLAPEVALRHAAAVVEALCYLHALPEPVAHCDIKPGNLLAPHEGRPLLIDFGSAALVGAGGVQAAPERYGTPGYAAPEQYRASPALASDIYGLGATLYHLLTGDDPACHPLAFPMLDGLPPAIAALLGATLKHDPAERPTAEALRNELHAIAARHLA
jgi:hypothetical protein